MKINLLRALLFLAIGIVSSVTVASTKTISVLGAGEVWIFPESGGHGIGMVALDVAGLSRGANFSTEFNTDTLRLHYGGIQFANKKIELGFIATGEAVFSGLLPDYYRLGEMDPERGFNAHYVLFGAYLKANLPYSNYLGLHYNVRKWFFSDGKETSDALVRPPQAWVFEPRLKYTFWKLGGGLGGRHRLFRRSNGFAFGIVLGLDYRSKVSPWGAINQTVFATPDTRNAPDRLAFLGIQWLKAGWQFHPKVRVQLSQSSMLAQGTDDLNRERIGGMNPYVVPISGAPWAAFLSEQFVAAELSMHFLLFNTTEVGVIGNIVYLEDEQRTGHSPANAQAGVGAFYDMAFGDNQLDARLGWSPTMNWQSNAGQFAAFLSYGRSWTI